MRCLLPLCLLLVATGCIDDAQQESFADRDNDGFGDVEAGYTDCDDSDAEIDPDADETCDGVDNDCDGDIDETGATGEQIFYTDADGDGFGDASTAATGCTGDTLDNTDCDDSDAAANPDATESCDPGDQDCDGDVDEEGASGQQTFYDDADGDGYGDASTGAVACTGGSTDPTDCDDTNTDANPGATEVCDGAVDEDCDGAVDEAGATGEQTWYADTDGDGFGDPGASFVACAGGVMDDTDCDDTDASIHPGGTEVCDGVNDEDCDGTVDGPGADQQTFYEDNDGDGFGDDSTGVLGCSGDTTSGGDCDDGDASAYPGATEVCDGSVDEDCDGSIDEAGATGEGTWYDDDDGDGYGDDGSASTACDGDVSSGGDCNDSDPAVKPGVTDDCDGVDSDCNGTVDDDADWGTTSCPVESCAELLALDGGAGDGTYWLADGTGAYQAECDMTTDGGGWTVVTGALISGRNWTTFETFGPGASSGEWNGDALMLTPVSAENGSRCDAGAVRATVELPFEFSTWSGTWDATSTEANGNDSRTEPWGTATSMTSPTCGGQLKFGTEFDDEKAGGEWGTLPPSPQTHGWAATTVTSTSILRWEYMDGEVPPYPYTLQVDEIAVSVR